MPEKDRRRAPDGGEPLFTTSCCNMVDAIRTTLQETLFGMVLKSTFFVVFGFGLGWLLSTTTTRVDFQKVFFVG